MWFAGLGIGLFDGQKQLRVELLLLQLDRGTNCVKRLFFQMEVEQLVRGVLVRDRKRSAERAKIGARLADDHRRGALAKPLGSEVNIHIITNIHDLTYFNKLKRVHNPSILIMKKEAVKKWIKGFFPARQGKPLQTTNI